MRILIPAAGEGKRFADAGHVFPKPLIDARGKPMIQRVIENLPDADEYVFIVQEEHVEKFNIDEMLRSLVGDAKIVTVDHVTQGAACTVLLAKEHIDDDEPLLIANADQIMRYRAENFNVLRRWSDPDGIIFAFNAVHPKWSFARLNEMDCVIEVAEKRPISNVATCGVYYWKSGSRFVDCAESMISKDIRTNGEFYLCPVYNELIETDGVVLPFFVDKMMGLGTPEDLEQYLRMM